MQPTVSPPVPPPCAPTVESTADALARRDAAMTMLTYLLPAPGRPFPPGGRREWLDIVQRALEYLYDDR